MGKLLSIVAMLGLLGGASLSRFSTSAVAQTATPAAGCNGQVSSLPMQGHYTGSWQTTGLYHFYVFGTDLELGITINGTIDAQLEPGGILSGTARGDVQAPITHDGKQDISSGYGTISGSINGVVTPTGTSLVLAQPVIDMHWGTFDQGYTVERVIDMPNFTITLGSQNCVGLNGTVSEDGFPEQNVVDDGTPYVTHASGIGQSNGTWSLQSDGTATFTQLSAQVTSFITSANAALATPSVSPAVLQAQVVAPLAALVAQIKVHPDIQGCLLERLAAWQASVAPGLLQQVQILAASGTLAGARQAGDLLRIARVIDTDCSIPDAGVASAITTTLGSALDSAVATRRWSDAALVTRELLLTEPATVVTPHLDADLHALIPTLSNPADIRDAARMAFAFGDDADATTAYQRILAGTHLTAHATKATTHHHKKKKHHRTTARPKPTATPTPSPTSTPKPKTLIEVLREGIETLPTASSGGTTPIFRWSPVTGAQRYVVLMTSDTGGAIDWAWSGSTTSVTYGDTSLDTVAGSAPPWTVAPDPSGWHWSVLALDAGGVIRGAAFRVGAH